MVVLCACMSVHSMHAVPAGAGRKGGVRSTESGLQVAVSWKLKQDPLREQSGLLTAEPS